LWKKDFLSKVCGSKNSSYICAALLGTISAYNRRIFFKKIKNNRNEKNVSTIQEKEKEQAWL